MLEEGARSVGCASSPDHAMAHVPEVMPAPLGCAVDKSFPPFGDKKFNSESVAMDVGFQIFAIPTISDINTNPVFLGGFAEVFNLTYDFRFDEVLRFIPIQHFIESTGSIFWPDNFHQPSFF